MPAADASGIPSSKNQGILEFFPFLRMTYEIDRAKLPRVIMMRLDVVPVELKCIAEPGNELDEGFVCSVGEFSAAVRMTAFDRYCV